MNDRFLPTRFICRLTDDPFAFSAAYNESIKTKEDMIVAPYELDRDGKTKSFSLL